MRRHERVFGLVCSCCLVFAYWYFFVIHDSLQDFAVVVAVVLVVPGLAWATLWLGRHRLNRRT
jgi:hypothetical protein